MSDINTVEEHKFDAESGKMLQIVINNLYTDKGIAIRELISNASDACEKLKYQSLTNPDLMEESEEFCIDIVLDKDKKTLTIADNGIGMNKKDLIDNLGTIARSGTQKFMDKVKDDASSTVELIGHFGVGFYSAFMVANKVVVKSRKAGEKQVNIWSSKGDGTYVIEKSTEDATHGTSITLYIKNEEESYLDKFRIEHLVTTYSNHISFPIRLKKDKKDELGNDIAVEDGDDKVVEENEQKEVEPSDDYEQLNEGSALWCRDAKSITEEEHRKFFQGMAHVGGDPWMIIHNRNEGAIEYINMLYIPSIKPFDLFHPDRKCSVKLYINKIFITESNVEMVPSYLRFLRGLIDSADLPLNISRETLQHNSVVAKIKQSLTNRVIKELKNKLAKDADSYDNVFWKNFGAVLKEGLCEYMVADDREKLLAICRFYSNKEKKLITIDEYIKSMKEGQDTVYFLTNNSIDTAQKSPQIEGFANKGIDVLLLTDPVDDFWTNVNSDYKDVKIKSITRSDVDLEQFSSKENKEESTTVEHDESKVKNIFDYIKKVLGEKISEVRISKKLVDSPVCLAVKEGSMDLRMERFMMEQKQIHSRSAKVLEVNMSHPVITKLNELIDTDEGNDVVQLLFSQACIVEGEELEDPKDFCDIINRTIVG